MDKENISSPVRMQAAPPRVAAYKKQRLKDAGESQRKTLEKIVKDFESAPARGNSTDEMLARTEYMLAKKMLSASQQAGES